MTVRSYPARREVTLTLVGDSLPRGGKATGYFVDENGLKQGGALEEVTAAGVLPDTPVRACAAPAEGKLYLYGDGCLYAGNEDGSGFALLSHTPAGEPCFCTEYVDGVGEQTVMFDGGKAYRMADGVAEEGAASGEVTCAALHYGRVFRACGHTLFWDCADGAVAEQTDGIDGCGLLTLPAAGGDVVALVSYGSRLVILRETALAVLKAYGQPELFTLEGQTATAGGVIAHTAALCGEKVFFCTSEGLFAYDGDMERITHPFDGDLYDPVEGAGYGVSYAVICTSRRLKKRVVLVYDSGRKNGYLLDVAADCLVAAKELVLFAGEHVYVWNAAARGTARWVSEVESFGSRGLKYLKSLTFTGEEGVSVKVSTLGISRKFTGSGTHRVDLAGWEYVFEVTGGNVSSLTATAEVRR